jgi:hypothetical protein
VTGVEWIVSEAVLGPASARAVLATRVWGLAFVVALAAALWLFPRGSRDDPADQRSLERT